MMTMEVSMYVLALLAGNGLTDPSREKHVSLAVL
jgi:hypothetical protein